MSHFFSCIQDTRTRALSHSHSSGCMMCIINTNLCMPMKSIHQQRERRGISGLCRGNNFILQHTHTLSFSTLLPSDCIYNTFMYRYTDLGVLSQCVLAHYPPHRDVSSYLSRMYGNICFSIHPANSAVTWPVTSEPGSHSHPWITLPSCLTDDVVCLSLEVLPLLSLLFSSHQSGTGSSWFCLSREFYFKTVQFFVFF